MGIKNFLKRANRWRWVVEKNIWEQEVSEKESLTFGTSIPSSLSPVFEVVPDLKDPVRG